MVDASDLETGDFTMTWQ